MPRIRGLPQRLRLPGRRGHTRRDVSRDACFAHRRRPPNQGTIPFTCPRFARWAATDALQRGSGAPQACFDATRKETLQNPARDTVSSAPASLHDVLYPRLFSYGWHQSRHPAIPVSGSSARRVSVELLRGGGRCRYRFEPSPHAAGRPRGHHGRGDGGRRLVAEGRLCAAPKAAAPSIAASDACASTSCRARAIAPRHGLIALDLGHPHVGQCHPPISAASAAASAWPPGRAPGTARASSRTSRRRRPARRDGRAGSSPGDAGISSSSRPRAASGARDRSGTPPAPGSGLSAHRTPRPASAHRPLANSRDHRAGVCTPVATRRRRGRVGAAAISSAGRPRRS